MPVFESGNARHACFSRCVWARHRNPSTCFPDAMAAALREGGNTPPLSSGHYSLSISGTAGPGTPASFRARASFANRFGCPLLLVASLHTVV